MLSFFLFVIFGLISHGYAQSNCQTPNGEHARCVPLRQCQVFLDAIRNNPSQATRNFLRDSQCAYTNTPWVCCGSVAEQLTPSSPLVSTGSSTNPNTDPRSHRNFNLLPEGRQCGVQVTDQRVVGGIETKLDEFPWMALLEYRQNGRSNGHACGGLLISSRYVLTAAHCVTGAILQARGTLFRVRLGEHDTRTTEDCRTEVEDNEQYKECSPPVQDITVEETIAHPNYNLDGQEYNDIALVRLSRPANLHDYVQPLCLPLNGQESPVGELLNIAGWGVTENAGSSDVKLKASIPVFAKQDCSAQFLKVRPPRRLAETQFCAGGLPGVDSCRGDSGGPIMNTIPGVTPIRWYVEGIVSFGPWPCGQRNFPGVYTKVSSYINWILDNMRP